MNTSKFMDKQIMDLSSTPQGSDFIDLMNPPQEEHRIGVGGNKDEILASYDFQSIRPSGSPRSTVLDAGNGGGGGSRAWNSTDSKTNAAYVRNYSSLDSTETAKMVQEKDRNVCDGALMSEIDHTIKKHADNLLHAIEGISARLSQLETRTRHLENSVDDLKISLGNNQGSTDGKMRQLENILREVQTGVVDIRDKQETVDALMQLAKLQLSKVAQQPEIPSPGHVDAMQQQQPSATASQQQPHQQMSCSIVPTQSHPGPSQPNSSFPAPAPQQNIPPPVQCQFPQNPINFSQISQTQEAPNQQYPPGLLPSIQQPQPPLPPPIQQPQPLAQPLQQYQPAPPSQYPQPPQQQPSLAAGIPSQLQPPLSHHPEEASYGSHSFPPGLRQPLSHTSSGAPPSQPFYGAHGHTHEPPSSRAGSGFSPYGPPTIPGDPYSFNGHPSQYGSNATMKPPQHSSAPMSQSGGSSYPQLPTARVLPQALPTASGISGGSGSAGSGNRVPVDDVVDKVTSMGFPRDHVRATVRRLTENGQAVDLNIVLDKLMNDGEVQPPKGWFGRD